jgi:hypothetical protein
MASTLAFTGLPAGDESPLQQVGGVSRFHRSLRRANAMSMLIPSDFIN